MPMFLGSRVVHNSRIRVLTASSLCLRRKKKSLLTFFQLRHLPLIHPVGVHDNQALLCLPENLRQPHLGSSRCAAYR